MKREIMKMFFYIILVLHALIHLLGFAKGQGWFMKGLQLPISKTAALFWLLAFLLFLGWGISTALRLENTWILGIAACVISQILIVSVWTDAKWGTIPNILLFVFCWIQFSENCFNQQWTHDTALLKKEIIYSDTFQPLECLPHPVQKWYHRSMQKRTNPIYGGTIHQCLELKLRPEHEDFKPATALQYTRIANPAFSWKVDVPFAFGIHLYGRDDYHHGKGSMKIYFHHLFPVVNASGPSLDEGTLQRFLGEMVWFPPLARSEYVVWESLDEYTAKATMTYEGVIGSGVFYYNREGDFIKFVAQRFYEQDQQYYDWVLEVQEYNIFDGVKAPSKMTATWKLPSGDWLWLHLKMDSLHYW
jgi:hypothetical protein